MRIEYDKQLREYNTFGIEARAKAFVEVTTVEELKELMRRPEFGEMDRLILGGGSNVLFTGDFEGLVVKNSIRGIEVVREDEDHVWVKAYGGEVWHELVMEVIRRGYGGIENLSLIPGSVGAAPMQNIGAYGVEIEQVFDRLESVNIESGEAEVFDHAACAFGYRNSVFKNELKGKHFILSIVLRLTKRNHHLNTSYGAIQQTLQETGISKPSIKDISDAVIAIRSSKLPDPNILGNAGSFFKNPEIEQEQFERLQRQYSDMPHYPLPSGMVKVPAGWLIEQCGWKGKKIGHTGSHAQQALVIVNYGDASGGEVWQLAQGIQQSVKDKFGIELLPEVNIL